MSALTMSQTEGFNRVPTCTGNHGKTRELFPVREKSGNFRSVGESYIR